jgi:hypothetical protein
LCIEALELLEAEGPALESEAEAFFERYAPELESGIQGVADKSFNSFKALKDYLGSPGANRAWHHLVEQCQVGKSNFTTQMINNLRNILSVDSATHAKISGYYNSIRPFSNNMRVRDWMAGQNFQFQFDFSLKVLRQFGVIK